MRNISWLRIGWPLIVVVPFLILGACSVNPETSSRHETNVGEDFMKNEQGVASITTLPPIDAAAPAEVETATFGLG